MPARCASTRLTPTSRRKLLTIRSREAEPERIMIEVGADDVKPVQIERRVVDDHQANRRAAQRVDGVDSRQRLACYARRSRCGPGGRDRRGSGGDATTGFATCVAARFATSGPTAVALSPAHRPGPCHATRKPPESSADPDIDKAAVIARERSASTPARGFSRASTRTAPVAARFTVPVISMSPPALDSAPLISPPLATRRRGERRRAQCELQAAGRAGLHPTSAR